MGYSIEASDRNFEEEVLEKSYQKPVIVDFFATWCGPCQMLKPILEKIAQEYDCVVAKVDTEENPSLASAFNVEGIPDVKIIANGQIIDGFVGVLPEPQLRELLAKHNIKSELEDGLAAIQGEIAEGNLEKAETLFQSFLAKYPDNRRVALEAAKFFIGTNQLEMAQSLLVPIGADEKEFFAEAQAVKALIQFKSEYSSPTGDSDLDRAFTKAAGLAVAAQYEEALELFLEVIETDRDYRDDGARKAMISIFDLLGNDNPLTREYRKKLTLALY